MLTKNRLPEKYCNLLFNKNILRWDEAIMLGNGDIGCLLWGTSNHLRFSLDKGDIWDKTPYEGIFKEEFSYKKIIELVKEKNGKEISRIFDSPYSNVTPTKLPAGKICFDFGINENIISDLNLATATAELDIGSKYFLKSYLHAENKIGFIQIKGQISNISYEILNPEFGVNESTTESQQGTGEISNGSLKLLKYEKARKYSDEIKSYFIQKIDDNFSYGIVCLKKQNLDTFEMVHKVIAGKTSDMDELIGEVFLTLEKELIIGFDKNKVTHDMWWSNFWSKSYLNIPDKKLEKMWYLTNYFLGSASRKKYYPMPLQGLWTADDGQLPPWKGDYHHDLNTQMTYYSYLKANHIEEGEVFIDFLWNLFPKGKEFAKSFYGTEGHCLPAVMSIDGLPLGGWAMYSLNPTQQLWLCQIFERHYRFTGNKDFLKEKVYPYFEETSKCLLELLKENEKGELFLPVSSSPEIHDNSIKSWLTPNSNYDLSLLKYLFESLKKFSQILNNEQKEFWESILKKLPSLAVNQYNVLMLAPDESLEYSHRHLAHTMAIHPLRLLNYSDDYAKKIIDATIEDLERKGTGEWVGYSWTWFAELFAIQKNGEGASYNLKTFFENFCSPNGFHLNGDYMKRGLTAAHYRPFTLEGNFCAADTLQEMLLQTDYGKIEIFPAIPKEWKDKVIEFQDFRGENGILISARLFSGILTVVLKPEYEGYYNLQLDGELISAEPICKNTIKDTTLELFLECNKIYKIIIKLKGEC